MYHYTWQMMVAELMALIFGLALMLPVFALGWYVIELREGAMFAWSIACAVMGAAPFCVAISNRH